MVVALEVPGNALRWTCNDGVSSKYYTGNDSVIAGYAFDELAFAG